RTSYFSPGNLAPVLQLLPATPLRDRLQALRLRGTLRDVDLLVKPAGPRQLPDLTGRARFQDVGFEPFGRFPGVDGADGRFEGTGAASVVHLDADDVTLDWPFRWRTPVTFQRIRGTVELARALGGVRIASDDAEVVTAHGEARGRLRLLARPEMTTLMDLDARATLSDVSAVPRYLPQDKLTTRALEWLDRAFVSGRVPEARVQITGPLRGFPYREGEGRFRATAKVEDLTLDYAPGWQPVTVATAEVEFAGPALRATASAGAIGQIGIRDGWAELADWREALLVIRANATADAGAARDFFASSPLAPRLGATFERLSAAGPLEAEVAMYLPIKQFENRAINVHGTAHDVSLALDGVDEPLTGVAGEFWVRNREFFATKLRGELLGGAAEAAVTSRWRSDGDLETRIDARGTLDAARLPRVLRLPVNAGLAGTTAWRGDWTLVRPEEASAPGGSRIRIESDLVGLSSRLPAPLDKEPRESRPLTLDLVAQGGESLRVRAGLGRNLRALLEFRREAGRLQIARGTVRLGGGEVGSLPVGPGLTVDGRLPFLSISDLTALKWSEPGTRRLEDMLAGVTLDIGRLEVLGYEFDGVSGRLRPGNKTWDVEISAPAAEGRLRIPYSFPGDVPLVADLDRLTVSPRVREPEGESDPARLPGMRLDIRDLVFLDWKLGHLDARIANVGNGVSLEEFTVTHPAFAARGSGAWREGPRGTETALRVDLDSGDVRGFLGAMALAPVIEAKKGAMQADVTWPGGPDATLLERISGKVRIVMNEGRVLTVEPGAGRILGLMSLSHLGRRLALDFEDLTGQGMAFDSVKGDFALTSGVAFTDNLALRGSTADVGIAGRTDLRQRTYDQTAVVTGDLGASLGVAGVIAGGPAVGAALLLFSQIFKEPLKGVARAYYRITGPWDDPLVRKIDARELEEAARIRAPATGGEAGR
ncbi:MAG TPA: YhdP family protein, partial [Pseudomonadales bacterium]|nr:YhdP family protein [Pseudomonadales bacterium]